MNLLTDLIAAVVIGGLFLLTFTLAELWRQSGRPDPESTRKLVHVVAGCITLSFPFVVSSHWTVLVMTLLFAAQLLRTQRLGGLRSVHGVERSTSGALLFPISIYLLFLLSSLTETPYLYIASVLVLAVSDALAGIIGVRFGRRRYYIGGEGKSLEGSLAFMLSAFVIVALVLLLALEMPLGLVLPLALLTATVTAVLEGISIGGFDNLTVPLGAWGTLMLGGANAHSGPVWTFISYFCHVQG